MGERRRWPLKEDKCVVLRGSQHLHRSLPTAVESFGADFASGFLFGEVLSKFNLQPDYSEFSKLPTSEAKLGNWIKLGYTMSAIGVNITPAIVWTHVRTVYCSLAQARDVMDEKSGAATRLAYQLFVLLSKGPKPTLSSVCFALFVSLDTLTHSIIENRASGRP